MLYEETTCSICDSCQPLCAAVRGEGLDLDYGTTIFICEKCLISLNKQFGAKMLKPAKRVVIESPLSGDFARNIRYARLCGLDCIRRKEAPYASHLLLTQFLNDAVPEDRALGMTVGFTWGVAADLVAVYTDLGISGGMRLGISKAEENGIKVEHRTLPGELLALLDANIQKTEGM